MQREQSEFSALQLHHPSSLLCSNELHLHWELYQAAATLVCVLSTTSIHQHCVAPCCYLTHMSRRSTCSCSLKPA